MEVVSQDHRHVHPAKRIGLDDESPGTQSCSHVPPLPRVAPADHDPGELPCGIGVSEEHHVEALLTQHPGRYPREPGPSRRIEDLDRDSMTGRRDREGVALDPLPRRARAQDQRGQQEQEEPA
jgi:hypothetical protein